MVEQFLISPEQHSVWRGHFHVDVVGDRVEVPLILEQGVDPILVQLRRIRISIYKKDQDQQIYPNRSVFCVKDHQQGEIDGSVLVMKTRSQGSQHSLKLGWIL